MGPDNIAASIRKARLNAGFTQKDVASALGKGQTTVASWETGRSQPDAATIIFLSNLFDVSSDYLLGISDISQLPYGDTTSDRIKCRRQQLGLSVENLAQQLNIPSYVIRRYENGELPKNWEQIMEIFPPLASALQCSPEYLIGWEHDHGTLGPGIDLHLPASHLAEKTGFDVRVLDNVIMGIYNSEDPAIHRKLFDPTVYHSLIARARKLQTEKNISKIRESLAFLDVAGQKEAVKRVEELTEIPKYHCTDD